MIKHKPWFYVGVIRDLLKIGLCIFGLVLWVVTWIALYVIPGYIIWHFVTKFW